MTTSLAEIEYQARRENLRRERWRYWRRRIGLVLGVMMAIGFVLWANWMVQRYVILHDDTVRGERFREGLNPTTGSPSERNAYIVNSCQVAAEVFYGHEMFSGDGYAPPNEKAFFVACSGITVGGRGGGQGD